MPPRSPSERPPACVEGAMRLMASRNLPDAIVGHQRQSAVNIVPVPRLEKAIHKCVVIARHFNSSRSSASSQRGIAPAPTNSATARVTASGCSNTRKCPARGRSITRTRSPHCSRSAWSLSGWPPSEGGYHDGGCEGRIPRHRIPHRCRAASLVGQAPNRSGAGARATDH